MPLDLLFRAPRDPSHPVDLIFGADEGGEVVNSIGFVVALPAPTGVFNLTSMLRDDIGFNIALPLPTLDFDLSYDIGLTTGPQARSSAGWQQGTRRQRSKATAFEQAARMQPSTTGRWAPGTPLRPTVRAGWQENTRLPVARRSVHQEATRRAGAPVSTRWQEATRLRQVRDANWQEATPRASAPVTTFWQEMGRHARPLAVAPWGEGTLLARDWLLQHNVASPHNAFYVVPWEEARKPPPGRTTILPPEPPEPDPCYLVPNGLAVQLLFSQAWDGSTGLLFLCERHTEGPVNPPQVVIPIRRVYMIINEVSLWHVASDTNIPCFSLSLSLDVDSWTWSFSASLPAQALSTVEPVAGVPTELEARINGSNYRVIAEGLSRDRVFANSRITVRGRGKSALLDAPYAPVINYGGFEDRTAQQLMADVLTENGVGIGWDVTWAAEMEDWLVPGGAWSGQGTYIKALNEIAAAAGAYIQPHRTLQELRVLHRYPYAPWDWLAEATPNFEIPAAIVTREGIEWAEKARYNRVFVSGQSVGVLGQVTREGTDGGLVAPMVTDALITAAAAARQRGRAILSDTGRQARVSLRMPVLELSGVIEPGNFVSYVDGGVTRFGIVRSTSVEVQGQANVWQSLGIETHVF